MQQTNRKYHTLWTIFTTLLSKQIITTDNTVCSMWPPLTVRRVRSRSIYWDGDWENVSILRLTDDGGEFSSSDYYLRFRGSDTLGNIRNKRAHIVADIFCTCFLILWKEVFSQGRKSVMVKSQISLSSCH